MTRRPLIACALVAGALAAGARDASASAAAQTIDRVLSRVGADVVTTSDVERVRRLKLVAPDATTDDAIQHALENRRLMLAEVSRFAISAPTADQLAARRTAWRARLGSGVDAAALLTAAGMTPDALDDWLRDDVRLDAYLAQQFTQPAADQRTAAIKTWVDGLRRRAGLPAIR